MPGVKKRIELVQRTPEEIKALYLKLIGFLLDNPEYQFIETESGIQIVIGPYKTVEKSAFAGVPDKPLKMP